MKVLVTGGAGYVGSTLVPLLLRKGHEVRVLDCLLHGGQALLPVWADEHFEFIKGDVRDRERVRDAVAGVDAVVHLAAIVGDPAGARDPDVTRAVNLDASVALLEEAKQAGVQRFVFASTCSNYGKMSDSNGYVDETSELRPVSLYAQTKVAFEQVLLDPEQTGDVCATPLRFSTIYGVSPRMRFDLTVNEFTKEMLVKKHLIVFGEQFWRPYIHVGDAARAICQVLEAPEEKVRNTVYNVGDTSQNYQKQQIVDIVQQYAPDAKIEYVRRDEDPRDYRVSFEKIRSGLQFEISRTVEDGVGEVAALVREHVVPDVEAAYYRN